MFPVVIWWQENSGSGHSNETNSPEHLLFGDLLSNQYTQRTNTTTHARLVFSGRKPNSRICCGVKKQQHVQFPEIISIVS
jgi:hypothetical protein